MSGALEDRRSQSSKTWRTQPAGFSGKVFILLFVASAVAMVASHFPFRVKVEIVQFFTRPAILACSLTPSAMTVSLDIPQQSGNWKIYTTVTGSCRTTKRAQGEYSTSSNFTELFIDTKTWAPLQCKACYLLTPTSWSCVVHQT